MTITVEDTATPGLQAMMARLANRQPIHAEMGLAVHKAVADHMLAVKVPQKNQLGGTSTGFWLKAIRSIGGKSDGTSATVTISKPGVALQYSGGTIKPRNKQWLTIPACAEAHGKSAREMPGGYAKQEWLFNRMGKPFAIAEKVAEQHGIQTRGRILFWLTKSATIRPHADVLPSETTIASAAALAGERYIARAFPK